MHRHLFQYSYFLVFHPEFSYIIKLFALLSLFFSFSSGNSVLRIHHGVPDSWPKIRSWLNNSHPVLAVRTPDAPSFSLKCPEVMELASYDKPPPQSFWNNFPTNLTKTDHSTTVNIKMFEELISVCKPKWSYQQKTIANRSAKVLRLGSKTDFKKNCKPVYNSVNAKSAIKNGRCITDTVASWIKKGYVIGPFFSPPFKKFNTSPLMAAVQKTKVRPILNLSAPLGSSFNDAVDKNRLRKLTMSSAKKFSQTLIRMGKDAKFAKSDIVDAYKIIPCHASEWRFFGFKWLGKFFADTSSPFGSTSAPAGFDDFGETVTNIAATISETPKSLIHRQLDDVPVVAPASSNIAESFSNTYKNVCKKLNVELAPPCPSFEKAFEPSTTGTVLGIRFDSSKMTWKLPVDKWTETTWLLSSFLDKKSSYLLEFQKLHGKINDFAQLGIFLKGFRFFQNNFFKKFDNNEKICLEIPEEVKIELRIWLKCIIDSKDGFPIPLIIENIPLFFIENFSDAAGAAFDSSNPSNPINDDRGAAAITIVDNCITHFSAVSWSYELLCKYPHNSAIFECIGLLMPFIEFPKIFAGKFVRCNVDNVSLVFNWEKKCTKKDDITYSLIQTLHLFEFALPCKIFVDHSPRRSSVETILVDNLSRANSTTKADLNMLRNAQKSRLSGPLASWCKDLNMCSSSLPVKIVDYSMQNKFS